MLDCATDRYAEAVQQSKQRTREDQAGLLPRPFPDWEWPSLIGPRDHSQAASMVIAPDSQEGSPENFHRGADQWVYVEDGVGEALINGHKYRLKAGALLLLQRGDKHEIRNSGKRPLKILNFHVP